METNEIIRRLRWIKAIYPEEMGHTAREKEIAADLAAIDAAIQMAKAVKEDGTEEFQAPDLSLADFYKLIAERRAGDDDDPATRVEVFTEELNFYGDVGGLFEGAKNAELTILTGLQLQDALNQRLAQAKLKKIAPTNRNTIAVLVAPERQGTAQ